MASHGISRTAFAVDRSEQARKDEMVRIEKYRGLVKLIELRVKVAEQQYTSDTLALTSKLLRENPEYYTIWNVRRRILLRAFASGVSNEKAGTNAPHSSPDDDSVKMSSETQTSEDLDTASYTAEPHSPVPDDSILETIRSDLDFLVPLLMQWLKCYWIWNYRIWLLQQARRRLSTAAARRLWQEELALVGKLLVRDSRNFHGWNYRRIVVGELDEGCAAGGGTSMVEAEFAYTTRMIGASLSNFSAWHYRSKLIPRLLNERGADVEARKQFLDDEFEMMTHALWTEDKDQSLWFYHQFLMSTLTESASLDLVVPHMSLVDRVAYVWQRIEVLKEMLEGAEDCKWLYIALLDYTVALWHMEDEAAQEGGSKETNKEVEEAQECAGWLAQLRQLDPLRRARWDEVERSLQRQKQQQQQQ